MQERQPLIGIRQEQQCPESDLDHRCLVSGEQQCHGGTGGLDVGDTVDRTQPGYHVVTGMSTLVLDQPHAVATQLGQPTF